MLSSSYLAVAALFLAGQDGVAAAKSEKAKLQREFMKAMQSSPTARYHKIKQRERRAAVAAAAAADATLSGSSSASSATSASSSASDYQLGKKLLEKATFVPSEEGQRSERKKQKEQRFLGNNNQQGDDGDGADDYFVAVGEWRNTFGFDPTQYSISYERCAEVRQYDTDIASMEDTDSVFSTKHFAVFRFCPALTCDGYDRESTAEDCDNGDCQANQQGSNNNNQNKNNNANSANSAYNQAYRGYNYYDRYDGCAEGEEGCEEEQQVWGANGAGCQSNYGTYMLELSEYLEIMVEYRSERFQAYCDYCYDCMYVSYQQWLKNQGGRKLRDITDEEWLRELEEAPEDDVRKLGGCPMYNQCKGYNNICGSDLEDDYAYYFECTKVSRNNNMVAYIGPHCAKDGQTITLGIYADQYCNEYIGNGVDIRNWLGDDLDVDGLREYYNDEEFPCIPCRAADQMFEGSTFQYGDSEQNWGEDEVTSLCESVYKYSARCDKHYRSYSNKAKYAKYYNKEYMDLSCDFIDSVIADNYDEMGFVRLNSTADSKDPLKRNFLTDNMVYEEYGHYAQEVTPIQAVGLGASMMVCGILALWSCALHNSLTKKPAWRPRRGPRVASPSSASYVNPAVTRQNSGIVLGRSVSGGSYYMT